MEFELSGNIDYHKQLHEACFGRVIYVRWWYALISSNDYLISSNFSFQPEPLSLVHLIPSTLDAVTKSHQLENELRALVSDHRKVNF